MINSIFKKSIHLQSRICKQILSKNKNCNNINFFNRSKCLDQFSMYQKFDKFYFSSAQENIIDQEEDEIKKFYTQNQILVEQNKFEDAIQNWNEMKSKLTLKGLSKEECDYQIAKVYLEKGEIQKSIQLFNDYLKEISGQEQYTDQILSEELFHIAQEFQKESQYEESIPFYQESLRKNNKNIEIHLMYLQNLIKNMNKNDAAIEHIYKIINHNELYTPILFSLLGEAYFNKREYGQSIDYYLKYLNVILNNSKKEMKSQEEAINEELKNANFEIASLFLKIASSYYFLNNYEKSLEYYLKNYEFQQEHKYEISHQMFLNMSELYLKLQQIPKSLEILQIGSENYPEMVEFQYFQGMININYLKNYDQAQQCFERAININKKHSDSYKQLGLIYLRQQKYEEAEEMFLNCIKIYHNDTDALYYMAYILQYHHKSPQDALICYQMCLDVNSELPAPLMQCAIIHYDAANFDKALDYITKAHQSDPDSEQIKLLYEKMKSKQTIVF